MAFALTKFKAYGVETVSPTRKWSVQRAELHITALAADVDLDIGDDSGTFWTAALADATYGALATKAQEVLQKIDDVVTGLIGVGSGELLDRAQVTALTGAGQYTLAIQNYRPNIAVDAGDGETSWVVSLEWAVKDGVLPINADSGAAA